MIAHTLWTIALAGLMALGGCGTQQAQPPAASGGQTFTTSSGGTLTIGGRVRAEAITRSR